jgi:hypothetical protein
MESHQSPGDSAAVIAVTETMQRVIWDWEVEELIGFKCVAMLIVQIHSAGLNVLRGEKGAR